MRRFMIVLCASAMMFAMVGTVQAAINIDGTITAGEWTGAATYTIGNGGGTAYFKADTSFIYGAFDLTGWTAAMGAGSQGNLLGFGVWKTSGGYGVNGVEFQQSTTPAAWGGDGLSGTWSSSDTLNGLASAWRINAQSPPANSIPGSLQAADNSFAGGHRVWEVMMPISTMGVSAGDTIWVVSGINFEGQQHWTPSDFISSQYTSYAPVPVEAGAAVPEPTTIIVWSLLGSLAIGLGWWRKRRAA